MDGNRGTRTSVCRVRRLGPCTCATSAFVSGPVLRGRNGFSFRDRGRGQRTSNYACECGHCGGAIREWLPINAKALESSIGERHRRKNAAPTMLPRVPRRGRAVGAADAVGHTCAKRPTWVALSRQSGAKSSN